MVDFTKSIQTVISCRSFKVFYWKASYVQVYIKRKPLPSLVQLVSRTQTRQRFCTQESFGNSCFLFLTSACPLEYWIRLNKWCCVAWEEQGACRTSSTPSASCQKKLKRVTYGHVPSDGNVTAENLAKQKHW
jgi:hypothetical protein